MFCRLFYPRTDYTLENFDNPFGTPPPVSTGFLISPSRVSPHVPPTPPATHVHIPHVSLHPGFIGGGKANKTSGFNPSTMSNQGMMWSTTPQPYQTLAGRLAKGLKPLPPTHVRLQPNLPGPSAGSLSSNMTPHMNKRTPSNTNEYHNSTSIPVRTSVIPSVYGGIASPPVIATPTQNPVALPCLAPNPTPEQTPVLPYLCSPAPSQEQKPSMGPLIVIEAASPTIDSESEYGESDTGGETAESLPNEDKAELRSPNRAHVRRTGLVGSPQGFVRPSSTFSSASSYSVCGTETSPSLSASSIRPHESSSSSVVLSASSSGDSSVTVTPARTGSAQNQRSSRAAIGSTSILSWIPRDFDELEREGVRGATC